MASEIKVKEQERMGILNERISRLELALIMLINQLSDPKYDFPKLTLDNISKLLFNRE